ncbi:unnamed protein product, partial [Prorocentrum cordatum]
MTPAQIVARFKDEANFPWYVFPQQLRTRRFEELWQLAHRTQNRAALSAVRLLTDAAHDRGRASASARGQPGAAGVQVASGDAPGPAAAPAPHLSSRSAKRAMRSGLEPGSAHGKGPRAAGAGLRGAAASDSASASDSARAPARGESAAASATGAAGAASARCDDAAASAEAAGCRASESAGALPAVSVATPRGRPPPGKAPPPAKAKPAGPPPPRPQARFARPGPGGALASPRDGPEEVSGPKLRALHWQSIGNIDEGSFWHNPPAAAATWNREELERIFGERKPQAGNASGASPRDGGAGAPPEQAKKKLTQVLDNKTSQNLAIQFGQLPPPERLAAIIAGLDRFPECLPSQGVLSLNAAVSEQEQYIQQIRELKVAEAGLSKLDLPERYLWVLGSVPLCSAKLACGALIVREAREIEDLRRAGEKVSTFCQLPRPRSARRGARSGPRRGRSSSSSCITTSLAIGNFMNRGTNRGNASGIWVPESLLRLDDCRGNRDAAEPHEDRSASLLDFVAKTIAFNPASPGAPALGEEAKLLLQRAKDAQGVPLEETEVNVKKVCSQALNAKKVLEDQMLNGRPSDAPQTPSSVGKLAQRVYSIYQEASAAAGIVARSKE